ncbi:MAG: CHAP domain-containing protein [Candidatus Moraniibacteriota bacterium]
MSTTSHFVCDVCGYNSGNCTWWAAYKRPDIAAAVSGSGWNGGQWYSKLAGKGFDVGSVPKVGAIVEFSGPGHVAHVGSLGENGSFSVSEMDAYNSLGFVNGVNYATYYRGSGNTYHRNTDRGTDVQGSWTLSGFIYRRLSGTNSYCDGINSSWGICWTPSSTDVSCQGGNNWTLYSFTQGSVIRVSTNSYCLPGGGVGGGIPSDPPDAQSQTPESVNVELDFDVLKPDTMQELYAGQNQLRQGQVVRLNAQLKAVHGNARDWMSPDKTKIETDFYVRINGGNWSKIARTYTRATNLDQGETHTEHVLYAIPQNAMKVSFYVKTDAEKELTETIEGDNVSRIETFTVTGPSALPAPTGLTVQAN